MGINTEDVARVRDSTDVVAVVSEHVALRRVGRQYMAPCPFHADKSPSFSLNPALGVYYCFGCGAKGDVITFVREIDHVDFAEAVERLAARAGIQLRYDDVQEGKDRQRRARLLDAMERAVEWYHQRLLTAPDAATARGYLRSRGYDGDVVRAFRMGWAPDEWDGLARELRLPDEVLTDAGLGFKNRAGRQQDAFRARVMFPIFDASDRAVAFGGRVLPGGEGSKYKNSQETPIYQKSRTLYALNWAKQDVVATGEVIVCEGYTDVIGFFGAGLRRAVATCGTALTEEHVRMLRNFADKRVVLAFDADAAGQTAAERFYAWEEKYQVNIAVAALPPGADPGDVARSDPDGLRRAVESARPYLAFRLERVLSSADMSSVEGRARAAAAAMGVIGEHPNELVRDQYVMQVADRCRIDPEKLRNLPPAPAGADRSRPPAGGEGRVARRDRPVDGPEVEALRLAVHRPEEVAHRLEEVLFDDECHLAAFRALASAETLHEAIAKADPEAANLLQRVAVEEADADADDVIARLAELAAQRAVSGLEADARASQDRSLELAPAMGWLKLTMMELREPATRVDASDRLVAWLLERG